MTRQFWFSVRKALVYWLLITMSGLSLVAIHLFRQSQLTGELVQLEQQLDVVQQQFSQRTQYQKDVTFYLLHASRWQQLGLTEPVNADRWIASWAALQQDGQLLHMQYEIQSSIACEDMQCDQFSPVKASGLSMTVTPVKMRWTGTHESEIIDWLEPLLQTYSGMLLVKNCSWAVTEASNAVESECELDWFNFPGLASKYSSREV
jgi:hypothetical protein